MGRWTRWIRRIGYVLRRDREESDVDEEMRFHIEMETRDLIARGVPPAEAVRRARVAFGGVDRNRERVREARGVARLDDLLRDVRTALRALRRTPGFTAAALLVLALGIGSTTAVFGVVRHVLLDPLPYPDGERLVRVWPAAPDRDASRVGFSVPDLRDWAGSTESLTALAGWTTILGDIVLRGEGPAEEVSTAYVSGDYFGVFGTPAALGRTLRPDEEDGDNRVVVFSHGYWTRRFGADPDLVGRTLTIDEQPFRVVGVMPPEFAAPGPDIEAWVFLSTVAQSSVPWRNRFVRILSGVGRMEAETDPVAVRSELAGVARGVAAANPDSNDGLVGATVVRLRDHIVGDVRTSLWVVLGAAGLLLLLACANVANLLLARGSARRGELAVRASLGAGRGRLVRQLLTESAVLGVGGGLGGAVVAGVLTPAFVARAGSLLPRTGEVGVDVGVLGFAGLLAVATTLLVGTVPAMRSASRGVAEGLRAAGRGSDRQGAGLRRTLVGVEVAVALMLLVGSGLLVRSLARIHAVDPGFDPRGVAHLSLTIATERYPERADYMAFYRSLLDRVAALPEVEAVGTIRRLPPDGGGERWSLAIPGLFEPGPDEDGDVEVIHVGGDVFPALGVELRAGRTFGPGDGADARPVVVVDGTLAERHFDGLDPVGRTIVVGGDEWEVVGVVEAVRHRGLLDPPAPTVYVHQEQNSRVGLTLVARTAADPARLLPALRDVVEGLDRDQPVAAVGLASRALADAAALPRFLTGIMAAFALLSAVLAGVGIYGVVAYAVRLQARETGLRLALGAPPERVVGRVLRDGLTPAAVGLAAGAVGAVLLSRYLDVLLYGVGRLDPVAYLLAGGLVVAVALVACVRPAVRAARSAPMDVLRAE